MSRYWQPEVETLPRSHLEVLQLERLRNQVERLYRESSFYREKWSGVPREIGSLEVCGGGSLWRSGP